eukprot:14019886-Heterocapsa_arctica.AAC.1
MITDLIFEETTTLAQSSATDRLASWKQWVKEACAKGGAAAHRFSRGPPAVPDCVLIDGKPAVGHMAIQALLKDCLPRWSSPT